MSDQPNGSAGSGPALAFGFTKKKTVQKVAANVEEKKDVGQIIKGIEGSVIQVDGPDPSASTKTYVIPKIENTYTTGVGSGGTGPRKFTPSFKPPSSDVNRAANGEDKFVLGQNTAPVIAEFGLQRREAPKDGPSADERPGTRLTPAQLEDRAYKEHVEDLPDDPDLEVRHNGGMRDGRMGCRCVCVGGGLSTYHMRTAACVWVPSTVPHAHKG